MKRPPFSDTGDWHSPGPGEIPERRVVEVLHASEELAAEAGGEKSKVIARVVFLMVALVTLYVLAPQIVDVWRELPRLRNVRWIWFPAMFALEAGSVASLWYLVRIALPDTPWSLAASAQLSGNAVSRFVPGGAPVGAALQFRMLSVGGTDPRQAATALGATGLLSTWVLFSVPVLALLFSVGGSPIPAGMASVAWGGSFLFFVLLGAGLFVSVSDWPLRTVGGPINRFTSWLATKRGKGGPVTSAELIEQRDGIVRSLGSNYRPALGAIVNNWLLDYLVLMSALLAIGSSPKFSPVLLAYAGAAVLAMIPITPGGLGFVEAGLTAMLILAGIPGQDALLATLFYRLFSYWLPLPAGLVAYLVFRRRFGRPPDLDPAQPQRPTGPNPHEPVVR